MLRAGCPGSSAHATKSLRRKSDSCLALLPVRQCLSRHQHNRRGTHRSGRRRDVARGSLNRPVPGDASGCAELVEILRHVVLYAQRQDVPLPGASRHGEAFQFLQHGEQPGLTFAPVVAPFHRHPLPAEQETHELRGRHGLDFVPLAVAGVAVDADQQAPLAPLFLASAAESATHDGTLSLEGEEPRADLTDRQVDHARQRRFRHRVPRARGDCAGSQPAPRVRHSSRARTPRTARRRPRARRERRPAARPAAARAATSTARSQAAVRNPCTTSASCSSSWLPISGQASVFTRAMASGSRRPRSAASLGSRFRSIVMERVRRPSASPSSRNAYGRAPSTACERGDGAVRSRHSTCTEPSSILPRSARKPSTSMVSCRQSSIVCFTSG